MIVDTKLHFCEKLTIVVCMGEILEIVKGEGCSEEVKRIYNVDWR